MLIKLIKVDDKYKHTWPDGSVEVYNAVVYSVEFADWKGEVVIGYTERKAYGKVRKRVVVFTDGYPEAEFVGADDYEETEHLIVMVRGRGKRYED